ncbi:DUF3795 domain-containing protein [bacterium]|nr:DUF3795 domain-containing protein [bacterium]
MGKMIAYCGLNCGECPAYLATQADDDEQRRKVAASWSKEFKADIKAEHINCAGCLVTDGVLFGHCQVCEIRNCGLARNVENCAFCPDYSCEKLEGFFKMVPPARKTLDSLRSRA